MLVIQIFNVIGALLVLSSPLWGTLALWTLLDILSGRPKKDYALNDFFGWFDE